MPSRPARDKWDYQRKMERHFPIKPRQPIGIALAPFISFPNSLIRAKNRFVKNGTANFDRNIPTKISGPPQEMIPNITVGRNRNGPFHLNSDRNFRNLWHNGKHPGFSPGIPVYWQSAKTADWWMVNDVNEADFRTATAYTSFCRRPPSYPASSFPLTSGLETASRQASMRSKGRRLEVRDW